MDEKKLKEAFNKIKEDMDYLFEQISDLKASVELLNAKKLEDQISIKDKKTPTLIPTLPTLNPKYPTLNEQTPTPKTSIEASNGQISMVSTGNGGVPTNQPTNQPTVQHPPISDGDDKISQLQRVSEIIKSLDDLKKEIRSKFKKLTNQEMVIYSTIYKITDQGIEVDYSLLAERLNLSEISIRDYIRKITRKGIPLYKEKRENNRVILIIPEDLKKIASINTINQLRDL